MKRIFYSNHYKVTLFTLLSVFLSHFAAGQFTVSGFLTTTDGNHMRDFAVVVTGSENLIVYTDFAGYYSFTLPAGALVELGPPPSALTCGANSSSISARSKVGKAVIRRTLPCDRGDPESRQGPPPQGPSAR